MKAVDYLHQNDIIHRDVTLENVLYVHGGESHGSGRVKLIDFGTAIKMEKGTLLEEIYGSPNYIAPEVLKKSYEFKADVWALGVICVKLVTGKMPFEAISDAQLFKNIQFKSFDFKRYALDANKSVACIDFMKRCLYKDPAQRFTAHDAFLHGWVRTRGRDPLEKDKIKECLKQILNFPNLSYIQLITTRYVSKKMLSQDELDEL